MINKRAQRDDPGRQQREASEEDADASQEKEHNNTAPCSLVLRVLHRAAFMFMDTEGRCVSHPGGSLGHDGADGIVDELALDRVQAAVVPHDRLHTHTAGGLGVGAFGGKRREEW